MTKPHLRPARLLHMQQRLYEMAYPTPEFYAYTRDFDLDHALIQAHAGIFAVVLAFFETEDRGHLVFHFDPAGVPTAVIEAVLFNQSRKPYEADLVAWPLHEPECFATALQHDEGADVLGAFHMPQRGGVPLWVHRTPLQWLQAGCEGCVPLKARIGACWLDKAGGPFAVGSLEDGRWLRDLLGSLACRHRILVAVTQGEEAT